MDPSILSHIRLYTHDICNIREINFFNAWVSSVSEVICTYVLFIDFFVPFRTLEKLC